MRRSRSASFTYSFSSFISAWPLPQDRLRGATTPDLKYFISRFHSILETQVACHGWQSWALLESAPAPACELLGMSASISHDDQACQWFVLVWQMRAASTLSQLKGHLRRIWSSALWCPSTASDFERMFTDDAFHAACRSLQPLDVLHALKLNWHARFVGGLKQDAHDEFSTREVDDDLIEVAENFQRSYNFEGNVRDLQFLRSQRTRESRTNSSGDFQFVDSIPGLAGLTLNERVIAKDALAAGGRAPKNDIYCLQNQLDNESSCWHLVGAATAGNGNIGTCDLCGISLAHACDKCSRPICLTCARVSWRMPAVNCEHVFDLVIKQKHRQLCHCPHHSVEAPNPASRRCNVCGLPACNQCIAALHNTKLLSQLARRAAERRERDRSKQLDGGTSRGRQFTMDIVGQLFRSGEACFFITPRSVPSAPAGREWLTRLLLELAGEYALLHSDRTYNARNQKDDRALFGFERASNWREQYDSFIERDFHALLDLLLLLRARRVISVDSAPSPHAMYDICCSVILRARSHASPIPSWNCTNAPLRARFDAWTTIPVTCALQCGSLPTLEALSLAWRRAYSNVSHFGAAFACGHGVISTAGHLPTTETQGWKCLNPACRLKGAVEQHGRFVNTRGITIEVSRRDGVVHRYGLWRCVHCNCPPSFGRTIFRSRDLVAASLASLRARASWSSDSRSIVDAEL